jgi:hypothetical protein
VRFKQDGGGVFMPTHAHLDLGLAVAGLEAPQDVRHQLPRQPPRRLGPFQRVKGLEERLLPVPVPAAEWVEIGLVRAGKAVALLAIRLGWHAPLDGRLLELGGVDLEDAREDDVVDHEEGQDQKGNEDEDVVEAQAVVRL